MSGFWLGPIATARGYRLHSFDEVGSTSTEAAQAVDRAVTAALNSGKIQSLAAGRMGMGTSEVGDLVASLV